MYVCMYVRKRKEVHTHVTQIWDICTYSIGFLKKDAHHKNYTYKFFVTKGIEKNDKDLFDSLCMEDF